MKEVKFKSGTWIAMDADGQWAWYESEPIIQSRDWMACDGNFEWLLQNMFTFPPCDDWRQSKYQINP